MLRDVTICRMDYITPGAVKAAQDQLRRQDIDATLMWLRHGGVGAVERRRMAVQLMRGSVAGQAVLEGVLSCGYCWDEGCQLCDPAYSFGGELHRARLMFGDL